MATATILFQNETKHCWSKDVLNYIVENIGEEITLDEMSSVAGMSKFQLCRTFQRKFGITPMKWLWKFRVSLAAELLKVKSNLNVTDVAFTCGFKSSAHFSRAFKESKAQAPSEFRSESREFGHATDVSHVDILDSIYEKDSPLMLLAMENSFASSVAVSK